MRIAYIYPALNTVGGADRVVTERATYLSEKKHYEVFIITAHQNNHPLSFPISSNVHHIDLNINFTKQYRYSLLQRGIIYFFLLREYKVRLGKTLQEIQADITISSISREMDFLGKLKDGSKKIAEANVAKPFLRNLQWLSDRGYLGRIASKLWTYKLEKAVKRLDQFVVLTHTDAEDWKKVRKATVIPNSVPFYPLQTIPSEEKVVISIGRMYPQKGFDRLIRTWKIVHQKYPDWKLHIYGKGPYKEQYLSLIESCNLEKSVIIISPTANIKEKYLASSFYVMSSRFEGFGMVLIEAMACGLPVIAFDCPHGPREIISEGEDGFLVEEGNTEALAEKIIFLIEHKSIRQQMGQNARKNVLRYSQEKVMNQWINLFHSLTDKYIQ